MKYALPLGNATLTGGAPFPCMEAGTPPAVGATAGFNLEWPGPSACGETRSAMRQSVAVPGGAAAASSRQWYTPIVEKCSSDESACHVTLHGSRPNIGSGLRLLSY